MNRSGHENQDHVEQYRELRPTLVNGAEIVQRVLTECLEEASVNYLSVNARAKEVDSFARKAARPHREHPNQPRYSSPLTEIEDLLAARVITYLPQSVDRVCAIIRKEFDVIREEDAGQRQRERGVYGYASKHFNVRLTGARAALHEYRCVRNRVFEIQVRTAVQHAWAEFEHDVRYKAEIPPERKAEFDRRFTLAAALIELADNEFTAIDRLYTEVAQQRRNDRAEVVTELDEASLTAWAEQRYPESQRSKREHYTWMLDVLDSLGIERLDQLDHQLRSVDPAEVAGAMQHRFPAGHVRRLDDDLLAALGDRYVTTAAANERRANVLRARLARLA